MRTRRIVMPKSARAGEVIQIKAVVQHPMITGHGATGGGTGQARDIVHQLVVTYEGAEIFKADLFPGIAANPFIAFTTTATVTGDIAFAWTEDSGAVTTETRTLTVT